MKKLSKWEIVEIEGKKRVPVHVRVTLEKRVAFYNKCISKGYTMQDKLEDAIDEFLNS